MYWYVDKCCSSICLLMLPLTSCLDKLQVTWRKALRRVWRIPNRTHCSILRGLHTGLCDKHMFISRFARFVVNALDTGPPHVKYIFKKALKIPSTLLARNTWLSCNVLDIALESLKNSDILHISRAQCHRECKPLQTLTCSMALSELYNTRDRLSDLFLNEHEINIFINELCLN